MASRSSSNKLVRDRQSMPVSARRIPVQPRAPVRGRRVGASSHVQPAGRHARLCGQQRRAAVRENEEDAARRSADARRSHRGVGADTSLFGATGPILGHRSRFEVSPAWGDLHFTNVIADVRHYVMPFTPLTIAGRFLHVGRYGTRCRIAAAVAAVCRLPHSGARLRHRLVRCRRVRSSTATECAPRSIPDRQQADRRRRRTAGAARRPLYRQTRIRADPGRALGFFDAGVAWDGSSRPADSATGRGRGRAASAPAFASTRWVI